MKSAIETTIQKFQLKYNSNLEKIEKLEENIKIANLAKKETTFQHVIFMSYIIFAVILFVFMFILAIGVNISPILLPFVYGIPLIGGPTIIKFMHKHYQVKERVHNFLKQENIKSEKDILEKEILYKIKLEKLKNKNEILKQTMENLESKNNYHKKLENFYNVERKENTELDTQQQETKNNLKSLMNILNTDTIKNVLQENFINDRDKFFKFTKPFTFSTLGSLGFFFSIMIPLVLGGLNPIDIPFKLLASIFGTVFVGTNIYFIKRQIIRDKVFNLINEQLGNNKLSKFENEKSLEGSKQINNSLGIEYLIMEITNQLTKYEEYNNLLKNSSEKLEENNNIHSINLLEYLEEYNEQKDMDDDKIKKYTP